MDRALTGQQQEIARQPDGQKEAPLWSFIPINRMLVPILHILLGLGNDLLDNFFHWIDYRIEQSTLAEIEARNMSLIASLSVEDAEEQVAERKEALVVVVADRIAINSSLKNSRQLLPLEIQELMVKKSTICSREVACHTSKNAAEHQLKTLKLALQSAETKEGDLRKSLGKKERPVKKGIEEDIFTKYKVEFSKYHGGAMEGPSIRLMMQNGADLFRDIATYIGNILEDRTEIEGVQLVEATASEVKDMCESHGRVALLLDRIFSKFNTERGCVTDALVAELKEELFVVMLNGNGWGCP